MFSLRMAASPSCPLGRDLCAAVRDHLAASPERDEDEVIVTLTEPHAPFLAEALGRLPILSEAAVTSATAELIAAAGRLSQDRPDEVVDAITEQMLRAACADCRAARGLPAASTTAPSWSGSSAAPGCSCPRRCPTPTRRGSSTRTPTWASSSSGWRRWDRSSPPATRTSGRLPWGSSTPRRRPWAAGRTAWTSIEEDGDYVLEANKDHTQDGARHRPHRGRRRARPLRGRDAPAQRRRRLDPGGRPGVRGRPSPASRASAPRRGRWTCSTGSSSTCDPSASTSTARRAGPSPSAWTTRRLATRLDPAARHRHDALHGQLLGAARRLTRASRRGSRHRDCWMRAGWLPAEDGVRARDGRRLSSTIAVRPTSVDLFTFANEAAEQLGGVRHRARGRGARPDRRHHARPAALAQRLRHAAAGAPAGPRS